MNIYSERLIRLADKLEGVGPYKEVGPVPDKKFDMKYLWSKKKGGGIILLKDFNPSECNTAACALGWAATDPWFEENGSYYTGAYWGISLAQYSRLFCAESYLEGRRVTQKKVAARIRRVARWNSILRLFHLKP